MAEMMVRRIGVLSLAKIQGLLMFVFGLIIGVIYGLIFMIFGAAMSSLTRGGDNQMMGGVSSIVFGVIMMVTIPIFYGILGFVGGAIGGLIYNIAAGIVGGVKLELEGTAAEYVPPMPPRQWSGSQA
jgi:hypothetical protein